MKNPHKFVSVTKFSSIFIMIEQRIERYGKVRER